MSSLNLVLPSYFLYQPLVWIFIGLSTPSLCLTPHPVLILRWEHGVHIWRWSWLACGKGCDVTDALHPACVYLCVHVCLQGVPWSWLPNAPDYKQLAGSGFDQSDELLVVTCSMKMLDWSINHNCGSPTCNILNVTSWSQYTSYLPTMSFSLSVFCINCYLSECSA